MADERKLKELSQENRTQLSDQSFLLKDTERASLQEPLSTDLTRDRYAENIIDRIDRLKDEELQQELATYSNLKPWHAVRNTRIEKHQHAIDDLVMSDSDRDRKHPPAERFALSTYGSEPRETETTPTTERLDEESFNCTVPLDIAHEIAGIGPLEPETIQYLHGKYGYIEQHIEPALAEYQSERNPKNFTRAAEHAERHFLPDRQEICPARAERAQLQIRQIQSIEQQLEHLPRVRHYAELTIETDARNACYQLTNAKDVSWQKTDHPPALQRVFDEALPERQERLEQDQTPLVKLRTRTMITTIRRDVRHLKTELERTVDEEPPPGEFCTIRISPTHYSVRPWTARTIEEFDRIDPDCPATPGAIRLIVEVDRQWKLWQSRVEHIKSRLTDKTIEQSEHESRWKDQNEYDLDDFDR